MLHANLPSNQESHWKQTSAPHHTLSALAASLSITNHSVCRQQHIVNSTQIQQKPLPKKPSYTSFNQPEKQIRRLPSNAQLSTLYSQAGQNQSFAQQPTKQTPILHINTRNLQQHSQKFATAPRNIPQKISTANIPSRIVSRRLDSHDSITSTSQTSSPSTPSLASPCVSTPSDLSVSPTSPIETLSKKSSSASLNFLPNPFTVEKEVSCGMQRIGNHLLCSKFLSEYFVFEQLGSGGFGFVHAGMRKCDGRDIAIKFIYKHKVPVTGWVQDDIRVVPMEIYLLRRIRHHNVISYIDCFEDRMFFYMITELHGSPWAGNSSSPPTSISSSCPNLLPPQVRSLQRKQSCDLFECIEQYSRFSEKRSRIVFKQIVEAVHHLNSLGIVHRDIKDENLLIDKDFNVKLIDFGSAAFIPQGDVHFDRFLGTIQYASPEILRGEKYKGPEAEIWALGCCLYIMLTGEVPFENPQHALTGRYTRPKHYLSPDCVGLLDSMFQIDIARRATIKEVHESAWLCGMHS
ncbi:hypothetical protein HK098_007722 [Nowakowskiella sp. JEL0407]|nr:hypothetical protein HK098_007722 [Nowakowskiella sp. JEL0407]